MKEPKQLRIDGIGFSTDNVVRLTNFYKKLLNADNRSDDPDHQTLDNGGMGVGFVRNGANDIWGSGETNISITVTVDDVDVEYDRLQALGIDVEPPVLQPWGAKNMVLHDPDGNRIVMRSFPQHTIPAR